MLYLCSIKGDKRIKAPNSLTPERWKATHNVRQSI